MTGDVWLTFGAAWLGFFLAAAAPGPNMIAVAATSLGAGRGPGLIVTCGIATGGFVWALLSSFGLAAVLEAFPWAIRALGLLGGGYLLFLGLKALKGAWKGGQQSIRAQHERGFWRLYSKGLLVVATNPKAALFWLSISSLVNTATPSPALLLLFAAGASALALAIYGTYALLFSLPGVRAFYAGVSRPLEALFGGLFSLIGVRLMAG